MTVSVLVSGEAVPISRAVFTTLLDNSVAGTYVGYENALNSGSIKHADLLMLARRGDIPYPLFFAPLPVVEAQVQLKTEKLLAGVSKETFSIGSRSRVELRDVELIVKDLIRKQELLKKHDHTLVRNQFVGMLRSPGASPEEDAKRILDALELSHEALHSSKNKEVALELLIDRLEAKQILVSRSVQNYMPQRLSHVKFSGMTIKDNKVPIVFLAGGDHGDHQEPVGRTIFSLALMTVLVAQKIFAPVTWDGASAETDLGREYDVAGAMLMPEQQLKLAKLNTLDQVRIASDKFKVTPSAVAVRAMRLGLIDRDLAAAYLEELRVEFYNRPKSSGARTPILPENAVRKYGGRELSRRMLRALDNSQISTGEFCRVVCLKRLKPHQIDDLRRVVR